MTSRPFALSESVEGLRRAFDQGFSFRPNASVQELEDLLSFRIAGEQYGVRVREVSGLVPSQPVTPVPSSVAALRGISAIRGVIIPVYCLAEILGYGRDHSQMRWVLLFGAHEPIGLSFGSLEGYARIPSSDLCVAENAEAARKHVSQVARIGDLICPVISLASVARTIKGEATLAGQQLEK